MSLLLQHQKVAFYCSHLGQSGGWSQSLQSLAEGGQYLQSVIYKETHIVTYNHTGAGLLKCYKRLQYQMSGKTGRQNGPHLPVFHNLKQSYQFASRGQCRVSLSVRRETMTCTDQRPVKLQPTPLHFGSHVESKLYRVPGGRPANTAFCLASSDLF